MKYNIHEAKSQLSTLGELAWNGEEVIITKAGKPYLRLTPCRKSLESRVPGALKGQIQMTAEFDKTDKDIIALFEDS